MRLFKITYNLKNNGTFTVGIIADNRENAVKYLNKNQKNVKNIQSIYIGDEVHAIDNNIVDTYVNRTNKVKSLKEDISYLKNCLIESDEIIEKLRDNPVESVSVNENEVAILHEKIVELEMEKSQLESSDGNKQKVFVCPECEKEFNSTKAVKIHHGKTHKG